MHILLILTCPGVSGGGTSRVSFLLAELRIIIFFLIVFYFPEGGESLSWSFFCAIRQALVLVGRWASLPWRQYLFQFI